MKIEKTLGLLLRAQTKYENIIGGVECQIVKNVDFDFCIVWQPSDGFVICDMDGNNSALSTCLEIINNIGLLTHKKFKENLI